MVVFLQPHRHESLLGHFALALAEHIAAEHGGKREGDERGGEQSRDEGYAQRNEHPALHAAEEEERGEADDDDERGVENRHAHLARGVVDQFYYRHPVGFGQLSVLPYVLVHVLHIHYGVVHERADGNGKSAERHGVYAYAHGVEHYHCHEEGKRDGDERDDGGARIGEEYHQHYDHEDCSLDERLLHVVHAALYEVSLAEDVCRDMYVCRQVALQLVERTVELFGELQRAGVWLLGHGEEHRGVCLLARCSELRRLVAHLYVCHVGKRYDALAVLLHDARPELVEVVGRRYASDDVFVAVFIAHAAVGVGVHATCARHHVGERNAEVLHLAGADEYLILLYVAAMHADLCHAARGEQVRTDYPVGIRPEVLQRGLVARQTDDEHFAED